MTFRNKQLNGLGFILFFAVSSCTTAPTNSDIKIKTGDQFILQKPITIPANHTRQFIQFGQLTTRSHFNRQEQHCRLEVKTLSDKPQTIPPQTFTITRIQFDEEMIARSQEILVKHPLYAFSQYATTVTDANPTLLTSISEPQRAESMDIIHLYLDDNNQSNILRLTCASSLSDGNLADLPRSLRPQKRQINQILGTFGHLNP